VVFRGSLVVLGFASSFLWVVLLLVLVNAVGSVSDVLSQSLIQLGAPRGLRGRAGGAWVVWRSARRRWASSRSVRWRRSSA